MKTKEQKKKETKAFFKELKASVLLELAWNILTFIPRMIFRFIREIW